MRQLFRHGTVAHEQDGGWPGARVLLCDSAGVPTSRLAAVHGGNSPIRKYVNTHVLGEFKLCK